jgi:hypothetical protein
VLNRANDSRGWPTSVRLFVFELRQLFPDAKSEEVVEACKRLAMKGALVLSKKEPLRGSVQPLRGAPQVLLHNYQGEHEDEAFFYEDRNELWFQRAPMTRPTSKNYEAWSSCRWDSKTIGNSGRRV